MLTSDTIVAAATAPGAAALAVIRLSGSAAHADEDVTWRDFAAAISAASSSPAAS